MSWVSRALFGTTTTTNSQSPQSDNSEDEGNISDISSGPETTQSDNAEGEGKSSDTASGLETSQSDDVQNIGKTSDTPSGPGTPHSDDAQDVGKTIDKASVPGTSPRGSLPDYDSDTSSNGSRRSNVSRPQTSERVARKRKSLPRLRTSGPTSPLEPQQGDMSSRAREVGPVSEPGHALLTREVRETLTSGPRRAALISSSSGANAVTDPEVPKTALEPPNPDPLSLGTQEAINKDVVPTAPDALDELPQPRFSLAEHYTIQHRREPPRDFAESMKKAEEDHVGLAKQVRDLSKAAYEDRRKYDEELRRRDLEIVAFRKMLGETSSQEENLTRAASVPDYLTLTDNNISRLDVPAPGRQKVGIQKVEKPAIRHSDTAKAMQQMIIEMMLERAEVAELYKEWESMAGLAARALDEATILMSGPLMARSCFHGGVALYRLGLYWEATSTLENSKNYTHGKAERVEVEAWLNKAKKAQTAAQSALSRQSSIFVPTPMKPRTDSVLVTGAPTTLKDELDFASDFDSVTGFGSRTPSVQSLLPSSARTASAQSLLANVARTLSVQRLASVAESPDERQPRSVERGPEVRDSRLRVSSLNRRSPMYSPMRLTPGTPRIPSPLVPQQRMSLGEHLGRSFSSLGRPPSSPLARRPDSGGISNNRKRSVSDALRYSAVLRQATTFDARRQSSQLRGMDGRLSATIPRRPSAMIREIEEIELEAKADLYPVSEASEASADHVRNEKRPGSKEDLKVELDGPLGDSRLDKGDKSARKPPLTGNLEHAKQLTDRLQPLASQQEESISPGTVPCAGPFVDDEFAFQGGVNRTEEHSVLPVQPDHDSQENLTRGEEQKKVLDRARGEQRDRSAPRADLDRNAEYLANLEKDGEAIPQEALESDQESTEQAYTEPNAGTTSDQTLSNDLSSDAEDQNTTIAESPVEKGGPDDLYGVEDGYAIPSSDPTSGVSSPLTEKEEGSDVEWEIVPREANASPPALTEPLSIAGGAPSEGIEIDMPQGQVQEAEPPTGRIDEEEVAREIDTKPPVGRAAEEEPAGQEGAINEFRGTGEAKKDDEETNEPRRSSESPRSGEGKANNSQKAKKRKKRGKR